MEKGSQHIAFDTLLALYHKELSLKEVHQYKKHLETCETCQDILSGIAAFDNTALLQPEPQFSGKPLEEKLLKINKQHVRQTQYKAIRDNLYKYFPFLAASVLLIFFLPFNVNHLQETHKTVKAENKASTSVIETIKDIQIARNNHSTKQKKSNNHLTEKQNNSTNTPQANQPLAEQQTPVFANLSKDAVASGLVKENAFSNKTIPSTPKNSPIKQEGNRTFLHNKNIIINDLERIKVTKIPHNTKLNLAPVQAMNLAHYDKPTRATPVTPKFYAQYGLSHMRSTAKRTTDEIPLTQRIQLDTIVGSKISNHLVDAYSNTTGLDLALGCQISRHVGFELGASYVYSSENLIDEEVIKRSYDRLYVTNRRFTLSPALTLQTKGEKWRPFARLGVLIPMEGQTQRRQISNQAKLVHKILSYVTVGDDFDAAEANFESDSAIKWRSSLGYNGAIGLRYQLNDNFELFGTLSYTHLPMKGKNYEMPKADLIVGDGIDRNMLELMDILNHAYYTNESVNFSTLNFSLGARFNLGGE